MTPLEEVLARRIRTQGPLTVAEFMAEALGHPEYGYYATRDPLGRRGDFTTAPEISQIFGELIGLWCVDLWDRAGRPAPFILAELGPGRGTLMADAMRAARVMPEFLAALRLHLVETSPVLRQVQHRTLKRFAPSWHDSIASLPAGPLLVIANEFIDALPIRQLVKTDAGWREKLVGLSAEADTLAFALAPGASPAIALVAAELRGAPTGSVCEVSPAGVAVVDAVLPVDERGVDGVLPVILSQGIKAILERKPIVRLLRNENRRGIIDLKRPVAGNGVAGEVRAAVRTP